MSKLYVPEALLLDVLSRLPAKTILRFRRVSKSWCNLIESRYFSKMNLNRLIATDSNSRLIVCGYSYTHGKHRLYSIDCSTNDVKEFNFPSLKYNKNMGIELLGSINGVVCLSYAFRKIVIMNPLSQCYIEISRPVIHHSYHYQRSSAYGFAYDKSTNDYNVVSLVTILSKSGSPVWYDGMIYSLKSNSWKSIENYAYHVQEQDGILVNGALHWITQKDLILSFDLADKKFHIIPQPNYLNTVMVVSIGVLGDCLSLTVRFRGSRYFDNFEIWVMNDYGVKDSWTRNDLGPQLMFQRHWFIKPISYLASNRQVIIQNGREQLLLCNLDKQLLETIDAHPYDRDDRLKAYPYIETLECCDFTRHDTSSKSKEHKRRRGRDMTDIDIDAYGLLSWKTIKP